MIKRWLCLCAVLLLAGCSTDREVVEENECWRQEKLVIHEEYGIEGILTLPLQKKSDIGVLLLAGSGTADADYTVQGAAIYRELAHGLAQDGIISLRMNKRNGEASTIQEEILEDAQRAISLLEKEAEKVYVIGHSLSAMILPVLEEKADGLILLAGSTAEIEEVYAAQLMKHADVKEQSRIEQELEMILSLKEDTGFSWFGIKESWWISMDELQLSKRLDSLSCPVLVMHGSEDDRIDVSELENYKEIFSDHPDAECIMMEGLDHYLMKEGHLHPSVIVEIASWILNRS